MEADCAFDAWVDCIGAEHSDPHRMFTGPDIGEVCSPSGDRPVERAEHLERCIDSPSHVPVAISNEDVASREKVIGDT
jgi:hypothetical protein